MPPRRPRLGGGRQMVGRGGDFRLGPGGGQVVVSSQRPPEGYRAGVLSPLDRSASLRGRERPSGQPAGGAPGRHSQRGRARAGVHMGAD